MTQTFRSEVIKATEGIAIRNVTLLFTDLKDSSALYQRIGDLNAYMQVQRHFERLLCYRYSPISKQLSALLW